MGRTSSVIGVQYEQISFADVTSTPESLLEGSVLFDTAKPIGQSVSNALSSHLNSAEAAAKAMEDRCFDMAKRTAANMPGGRRRGCKSGDGAPVLEDRQALMAAIRSWLHGNKIEEGIANACGDDSEQELASDDEACGAMTQNALTPPDAQVRSGTAARSMRIDGVEAQKKRRTCAASSSSSSSASSSSSSSSGSSVEGVPQNETKTSASQCARKAGASQSDKKYTATKSTRKSAPKKGRPRATPATRHKAVRGAAASESLGTAVAAAGIGAELRAMEGAAATQANAAPTQDASDGHGSVQGELEVPPGSDAVAADNAVRRVSVSDDASWGATTSGNGMHDVSAVVSQSSFVCLQGQTHGVMIDLDD